ncbi:rubredoxin-like domain-containing protein [Malonomonas rubra]|uniref:rubredoxin-like domain-containing protein n=1 Tax=Malonomonas rubra TaxID=57040 RepID=UPI0026F2BE60|nr:DUF2231 domain-containing protein [Malonomonas rubra]
MGKTWRCTVCGYLHKGDQPPENCPVCKVDACKFELVEEPASEVESQSVGKADFLKKQVKIFLEEMKIGFVPHAVGAHFPNALLPTAFLFLLIYIFGGGATFESAVFYLLLVVFLAVPVTFATGVLDWRKSFSGKLTPIFRKKIILGVALFVSVFITVAWRLLNPQVLTSGGLSACGYSLLILLMLGCVVMLGHYGGVLIFAKHQK